MTKQPSIRPKIKLTLIRPSGLTSQVALDGDSLTPIMLASAEDLLFTLCNGARPSLELVALTDEERESTVMALDSAGSFSLEDESPRGLAAIIRKLCGAMREAGLE